MKTVIKTTDGIAIMSLVEGADFDDALLKWKLANPEKYVSHRDMPDEAIPTDRDFRGAWEDTTSPLVIDINISKAKDIHLNRIREQRNAALLVLDVQAVKAADQNKLTELAEIKVKKQTLRDIPQTAATELAQATTTEQLAAQLQEIKVQIQALT